MPSSTHKPDIRRKADQLELGLEEAEAEAAASVPQLAARARDAAKPHRQPLRDHLPRKDVVHQPAASALTAAVPCGAWATKPFGPRIDDDGLKFLVADATDLITGLAAT